METSLQKMELKREIASLKRKLKVALEAQATPQPATKTQPVTKVTKPTRSRDDGRVAALKSDIAKLKLMLAEQPDAAKLRKKLVEQQVEMASLRHILKEVAKERDRYQKRVLPKFREATGLLTSQNYRAIVKALHSDRVQHVTPGELKAAERVFITLRPLFIDD
jgi:hypothetical protein